MAEPVSISELAEHLRLDTASSPLPEAVTLSIYRTAARQKVEDFLNVYIMRRSAEYRSNRAPVDAAVRLPLTPRGVAVGGVTISYETPEEVEAEFDAADYSVKTERLALKRGASWPIVSGRPDSFKVSYTTGFPDDDVPEALKNAILLEAAALYENRTATQSGVAFVNPAALELARPYRVDMGL